MFRYIGNKSKLLPQIISATQDVIGESGTVVDLMAGTGSVAAEYRRQGYHVIASDMMTYSWDHLVSQLLFSAPPRFAGLSNSFLVENTRYSDIVSYLNQLSGIEGYFFREFCPEGSPENGCSSRKYFSSSNACKIDAIRNQINLWIAKGLITKEEEAVLKHTLIMAVNDVANISGTYGYYLANLNKNALTSLQLVPIEFENKGRTDNIVLQGFAEDIAPSITADLCYIDPPYMKRQYAANYHILETIARGDFPVAVGKSGLRDWWDQHSKFCTKTRAATSFEKVLTSMNCSNFLVSYSEDGLLSVEQLVELFEKIGQVEVNKIDYTRFRSNQSPLPKEIKEYIIKIQKK